MKRRLAPVLSLLLGLSCTASFTVPVGPHPVRGGAPVPVDVAPPVARIERLPPRPPEGSCLWLDGRWERAAGTWEWTPGAWVIPPPGCHFAPPETTWRAGAGAGHLYYSRGRWYRSATSEPCGEPTPCR